MGFYVAITGIAEHYQIRWLVWPSYVLDPRVGLTADRARGPLLNTADQGWVLIGGAALACIRIPRSQGLARHLLLCLLGLCSIAVYFTYTRGVWLAFAAGMVSAAWLRRRTGTTTVIVVITAFFLVLMVSGLASKLSWYTPTLFSQRPETVEYREDNAKVAWEVFKTHPFVGVGYGKFAKNLEQYSLDHSLSPRPLDDGNHSFYLGLAAETGIVGLSLYLGIFWVVLRQLWSFRKRVSDGDIVLHELLAFGVAMAVTFLVQSQFGDWRFHLLPHNYLFVIFGMAAAAARPAELRRTTSDALSTAIARPSDRLARLLTGRRRA